MQKDNKDQANAGQNENNQGESFCWIFDGNTLHVEKGGTHAKNFPHLFSWERQKEGYIYRGWYDPYQKMISVVIPRREGQTTPALSESSLPTKLRVALGDRFGRDNVIKVF